MIKLYFKMLKSFVKSKKTLECFYKLITEMYPRLNYFNGVAYLISAVGRTSVI